MTAREAHNAAHGATLAALGILASALWMAVGLTLAPAPAEAFNGNPTPAGLAALWLLLVGSAGILLSLIAGAVRRYR